MRFRKTKITTVADAIAPLQNIVNDLKQVASNEHDAVINTDKIIKTLEAKKEVHKVEAALADIQMNKMLEFFGIAPLEKK